MDELIAEIEGVKLSPLKIIERPLGNIMHALKSTDDSFVSFGEAYFTFVNINQIKGWKKHSRMTLNLIVPVGKVKFVLFDQREQSKTFGKFMEITLGRQNYQRLTLDPGVWMAFKGLEDENMILNLASIPHDPSETEEKEIHEIAYAW